jgi:hypothetical protein
MTCEVFLVPSNPFLATSAAANSEDSTRLLLGTPLYSVVFPRSWLCCAFKLASLYRRSTDLQKARVTCQDAWRGPHRKYSLSCWNATFEVPAWSLPSQFIGALAATWQQSCIFVMLLGGKVFIAPLPSSGYTNYIMYGNANIKNNEKELVQGLPYLDCLPACLTYLINLFFWLFYVDTDSFIPSGSRLYIHTSMFNIVTCRPTVRERLGKQVRNRYSTNNRVDPSWQRPQYTHATIEQVLQEEFSVWVRAIPIARQRSNVGFLSKSYLEDNWH